MTTPQEISDRREAWEDDADNVRQDYPAAVRDLAATERKVEEQAQELALARDEIERLRDTNARLNRRAQVAESAINALVSANPARGRASNVAREVWERCMESHSKAFHRHEAAEAVARAMTLADEWERTRGGVFGAVHVMELRAALKGGDEA